LGVQRSDIKEEAWGIAPSRGTVAELHTQAALRVKTDCLGMVNECFTPIA